ncbi:MAG: antitoxin [Pseudomonadota bacterium]
MSKPATKDGYDARVTENCERVLVTLLSRLGPWKDSIYLIGGLAPRYLVPDRPPAVPAHAGTGDVDIVVELQMLANTDAYRTLEDNIKELGFERAENEKGEKQSWRWRTETGTGIPAILELLADDPETSGGKVQPLPVEGNVSALNIPHASMVFDHHHTQEIRAELIGEDGVAIETLRYADLVAFTCLKAFAFEHRRARKDSHDLVYCIEHGPGGIEAAVIEFRSALDGKHAAAIKKALAILERRFTDDARTEGYLKDGPVAVAKFELGEDDDDEVREARTLRQRYVSELIGKLMGASGPGRTELS